MIEFLFAALLLWWTGIQLFRFFITKKGTASTAPVWSMKQESFNQNIQKQILKKHNMQQNTRSEIHPARQK